MTELYRKDNTIYGTFRYRDGLWGACLATNNALWEDFPGILYRKTEMEAFEDLLERIPDGGHWLCGDINKAKAQIETAERVRQICSNWVEFCNRNSAYRFSSTGEISGGTYPNSYVISRGREVLQELRDLLGDDYGWEDFRFRMTLNNTLAGNIIYKICKEEGLL